LKAAARVAGAKVVAAQLFDELFVAVDDAVTTLDTGLRGVALAAFASRLENRRGRRGRGWWWGVWDTLLSGEKLRGDESTMFVCEAAGEWRFLTAPPA